MAPNALAMLRLAPFIPNNPDMWFSLVKSAFTLHDVADEAIRYHIVLNNLDSTYTEQVAEVITTMPAATP
jgi:hypothetical protein